MDKRKKGEDLRPHFGTVPAPLAVVVAAAVVDARVVVATEVAITVVVARVVVAVAVGPAVVEVDTTAPRALATA